MVEMFSAELLPHPDIRENAVVSPSTHYMCMSMSVVKDAFVTIAFFLF
jgi:hypothetical protein